VGGSRGFRTSSDRVMIQIGGRSRRPPATGYAAVMDTAGVTATEPPPIPPTPPPGPEPSPPLPEPEPSPTPGPDPAPPVPGPPPGPIDPST
jgi:hypothetical protein